jgi:hypothetical protein
MNCVKIRLITIFENAHLNLSQLGLFRNKKVFLTFQTLNLKDKCQLLYNEIRLISQDNYHEL